ncbi:hypothetical protein AAC387_Pa08g1126 [Persea americana]
MCFGEGEERRCECPFRVAEMTASSSGRKPARARSLAGNNPGQQNGCSLRPLEVADIRSTTPRDRMIVRSSGHMAARALRPSVCGPSSATQIHSSLHMPA